METVLKMCQPLKAKKKLKVIQKKSKLRFSGNLVIFMTSQMLQLVCDFCGHTSDLDSLKRLLYVCIRIVEM